MAKETKTITNLEYARSLTIKELGLIVRVATAFIDKLVGKEAPRDVREKAYVKWCVSTYDPDVWYRDYARLTEKTEEAYFYGV